MTLKLQEYMKRDEEMNKLFLRLATILLIIGVMAGCSSDENDKTASDTPTNTEEQADDSGSSEQAEETITIKISKDEAHEIIDEREVPIESDAILMDVLKENFEVEEDGGFITSIEGVSPKEDEEKAWMFFVNDEMATVGANDYELTPGDEVTFDLQAWE